jgi:signal transduction histidine kinase
MFPGAQFVFLSLVAGGTSVSLACYAWIRRDEPSATSFAALMAGAAVWSISYGVSLVVFDPGLRQITEIPTEVGRALIAPAWFAFTLGYTGRGELVSRRFAAALGVVPAATVVLLVTNDAHHLLWSNFRVVETWGVATVAYDPGPWLYVHVSYGLLLVLAGFAFVAEMVFSRDPRFRRQGLALTAGAAFPTLAYLKWTFAVPPAAQLDFTPMALAVMGVTFGYALFRFDLLGIVPATRRLGQRAAIDDVGVGLVITDRTGRILEANAEAASMCLDRDCEPGGDEATELSGRSIRSLVPDLALDPATGPQPIELGDWLHRRTYEVTPSAVTNGRGRLVGYTVSFHDVTEREHQRQRLEVLNRVLRHNLRNGMAVVMGQAQTLEERLDGPEARMVEAIHGRSERLVDLGEKARTIEQMLESDRRELVDAVDAVDASIRRARRAYSDCSFSVHAPESALVSTDGRVLSKVLDSIVENAAEHNTSAAPRVSVEVVAGDGEVAIAVSDNGPGIPAYELDAISAGRETPLSHGSGLGLWLAVWGARTLDADLSFDTGDAGTTVTLRLSGATRRSETDAEPDAGTDTGTVQLGLENSTAGDERPSPQSSDSTAAGSTASDVSARARSSR